MTNLSRSSPAIGDRLVGHRRHADVDHVDLVEQRVEALEGADAASLGVGGGLLRVLGVDADDLDVRPVDLLQGLEVERGREARADDAGANRFLILGHG